MHSTRGCVRPLTDRTVRSVASASIRWIAIGVCAGVVTSLALQTITTPTDAIDTAFALGALVFGFGLTMWAVAIGSGDTIERMHAITDADTGWTQAGARQAFAVLSWLGSGWLFGATAMSIAIGG